MSDASNGFSNPEFQGNASIPSGSDQPIIIRLWPALVMVAMQWGLIRLVSTLMPATFQQFIALFYGPILTLLGMAIWWLFASRISSWGIRLLGLFVVLGLGALSLFLVYHPSFSFFGVFVYALPWVNTAWAGWLLLSQGMRPTIRGFGFLLAMILVYGYFACFRMLGMDGSFEPELAWRWQSTSEDRYLAETKTGTKSKPVVQPREALKISRGDWSEFRGVKRDSRLSGVSIDTDWKANTPKKIWSRKVGPSWSSFAVIGDHVYTQEQLGETELVQCLDLKTGEERWTHKDENRFDEPVGGAGPRSTPTFFEGKIYSLGAKGILNCLDAVTGKKIWGVDIREESKAEIPMWAYSSSPLVVDGIVTVFVGDADNKSVRGYDALTGKLVWSSGKGKVSYCSTQLNTIAGIRQLLITSDVGLTSFDPKTGEVLWENSWPSKGIARVVQPAQIGDSDFLVGTGLGMGTRRVHVSREGNQWKTETVWETRKFLPYFNDFVLKDGILYGFDNNIFACVNLEDGIEKWRHRGYGNGQVLLLDDQKILLVLTEKGDVVLLEADPAGHKEIARMAGIKGKTWNHPVIAHGKLLIRNGEEMACFELKTK